MRVERTTEFVSSLSKVMSPKDLDYEYLRKASAAPEAEPAHGPPERILSTDHRPTLSADQLVGKLIV